MRIATWNLEWAKPGTQRHAAALDHLAAIDADVVVTTEDSVHDWDTNPHRVDGGSDWGYRVIEGRRKVIAWSKEPWDDVAVAESGAMAGRFVRGRTFLGAHRVTVIGVCIPWRDSHVRSGRRDRRPWEHHRAFCEELAAEVTAASANGAVIVAGDFNQRIPRINQPIAMADALALALDGLDVVTADPQGAASPLIDHIAISAELSACAVHPWPNSINDQRISDHGGVAVDLDWA